jgi:hypothetical protein
LLLKRKFFVGCSDIVDCLNFNVRNPEPDQFSYF